jgi:hypothetical protein
MVLLARLIWSNVVNVYQHLKRAYAYLLDAPPDVFDRTGITFIVTTRREQPEWANWILPVWLFKIEEVIVCSVTPFYAPAVRAIFSATPIHTLMDRRLFLQGRQVVDVE